MNSIAKSQSVFVEEIINTEDKSDFDSVGLKIYKSNLAFNAVNSLRISYPTVYQLLGEDFFNFLTKKLILDYPPKSGDWGIWGEELPNFINEFSILDDIPYLSEVAKLDWNCHIVERNSDYWLQEKSLDILLVSDADYVTLKLNPNISTFSSNFPVADIWLAHQLSAPERKEYLERITSQYSEMKTQYYLLFRPVFKACVRVISKDEYLWYQSLNNFSLGRAISKFKDSHFSFECWLKTAVEDNLIYTAKLVNRK